uniref:Uncharacterized protein n=1 Tax=Oryza rufipogon TaxID=4529 RepID=A0A0E0P972_ORYRU
MGSRGCRVRPGPWPCRAAAWRRPSAGPDVDEVQPPPGAEESSKKYIEVIDDARSNQQGASYSAERRHALLETNKDVETDCKHIVAGGGRCTQESPL